MWESSYLQYCAECCLNTILQVWSIFTLRSIYSLEHFPINHLYAASNCLTLRALGLLLPLPELLFPQVLMAPSLTSFRSLINCHPSVTIFYEMACMTLVLTISSQGKNSYDRMRFGPWSKKVIITIIIDALKFMMWARMAIFIKLVLQVHAPLRRLAGLMECQEPIPCHTQIYSIILKSP